MGDVTERYCAKCGTTVPEEARFCIECGLEMPIQPAVAAARATRIDPPGAGRQAVLETLRQATRGQYDVIAELGRGGMAVVFLAHDVTLDRKVAIKVFMPDMLGLAATVRERFQREARTAASLSHPHIIPIYAVQQNPKILYFVMKYVEGRSLDAVLREEGSLPVPMAVTILTQVGSALDYAHRKKVIHRDIKPANIMLDQEGYAIVTDFGIAKVAEAEGLTVTGSTMGTPAYMSPEQCMGLSVSGASDQYALGVVAYQMLTGSLPFEGESAMTVMYKHTHDPPRHIAEMSPGVPRPLADAVMQMLAKSPDDRFDSMASFAEKISTLREDAGAMRTQMISLARSKGQNIPTSPLHVTPGKHHATTEADEGRGSITAKLKSTPVTPIPESKPRKKKAVWLIPTAAVAAAVVWLVGPFGPGLSFTSSPSNEAQAQPDSQTPTPPVSTVTPTVSVADIAIDPVFATLRVGESMNLIATPTDSSGATLPDVPVIWESRDHGVLEVSQEGIIRGLAAGTTSVVVHALAHTTTVPVIVEALPERRQTTPNPPPVVVARLTVVPAAPTVAPGENVRLNVTAFDANGRSIGGRQARWTSSDPAVARVSDGVVTGVASGRANVTVAVDDRSETVLVTVSEAPVATVSVSPSSAEVREGQTVTVRAGALDRDGNALNRGISWRSEDPSVASVSPTGTITGVSAGATRVRVESEGRTAFVSVHVLAAPVIAPPPRDPAAEQAAVRGVIAAYGRAIEARDLAALRRVFPSLSQDASANFTRFFSTVTDLVVTLDVTNVRLDADTANATVAVRYVFRSEGSSRHSDFSLQMQFARTGDEWRIVQTR